MNPSRAFIAHRDELRAIGARHGALQPRIFGSAIHGRDTEGSDPDLLVEPAESTTLMTLAAIQPEAERLLGIHVDVLTPRSPPVVAKGYCGKPFRYEAAPPERVPEYLQHIVTAIDRALSYTDAMDFAAFEQGTRTQDAVIRGIES